MFTHSTKELVGGHALVPIALSKNQRSLNLLSPNPSSRLNQSLSPNQNLSPSLSLRKRKRKR